MKLTETENTKWLDDIYKKSFDCSKYPKTRITCRKLRYKVLEIL